MFISSSRRGVTGWTFLVIRVFIDFILSGWFVMAGMIFILRRVFRRIFVDFSLGCHRLFLNGGNIAMKVTRSGR